MRGKITGMLSFAIMLVLCGCTINSSGSEPVARPSESSALSPEADMEETALESEGTQSNREEELHVDSSFDFETKTVMLNSGYEMPINGIGTYSLLDDVCVDSVTAALRNGVRLIDTAYMYHNE